jgi:hypothetical protein
MIEGNRRAAPMPARMQVWGPSWFANVEHQGTRMAYIYHILVKEPYRRLGHAKRALLPSSQSLPHLAYAASGSSRLVTTSAWRAGYLQR